MILALDIGGTFIKWAAAEEYELIRTGKVPTPQDSFASLAEAIRGIIRDNHDLSFRGLAVSYPGMEDPKTGDLVPFGALTYGLGKPVRRMLEDAFCLPVSLENDGRLAAVAEARFGSLKDTDSGYVLVIGTGIGGTYVRNGVVETGSHGYAGQISLFLTGDLRKEGLSAIWSAKNAMPGFLNHAKEVLKRGTLSGEEFMKLVHDGDQTACALLDEYMDQFTNVLFTLQMLFDPERFSIGGGISADALFMDTMQKKYEELYAMYSLNVKKADIVPCTFRNTSNIMGALALYYDEHPNI